MSKSQPWDYFPLFPVYAFTDIKKARKKVKKITGKHYEPSDKAGCFTAYRHDDGVHMFGIIYLNNGESSTARKYAGLAHECVHYARTYADYIGNQLDEETEAYVVQCAMLACIDQIGEEWFAIPQTSKSSEE